MNVPGKGEINELSIAYRRFASARNKAFGTKGETPVPLHVPDVAMLAAMAARVGRELRTETLHGKMVVECFEWNGVLFFYTVDMVR